MIATPATEAQSPLRKVDRRLIRVTELIGHRPRMMMPSRSDDHPIRVYRRIILDLGFAGDDPDQVEKVVRRYPDLFQSHVLHYSADFFSRQQTESRLLTSQSYDEIGPKLSMSPKAIEYYEQLFFNVRDRLNCTDWIWKSIRDRMGDERERGCSVEEAERGYVMRAFAFSGGPHVLDALLSPMAAANSPSKNVNEWFKDGVKNGIAIMAAAGVFAKEFTHGQILRLVPLAAKNAPRVLSAEERKKDEEYCKRMMEVDEQIKAAMTGASQREETGAAKK